MDVIVHTMGRVGSSAVTRSLRRAFPDSTIHHVHALHPATLATQTAKAGSIAKIGRSIEEGFAASLALTSSPEPMKVVTMVRDVTSRNLSAAFASARRKRSSDELEAFVADEAAVRAHWDSFYDQRPHVWFDREVRDVLGIDLYAEPFPDSGWVRHQRVNVDLLAMRVEIPEDDKAALLGDWCGVEPMTIPTDFQRARHEAMGDTYTRFKAILLDDELRQADLATPYMQHFYPHVTS